MTIQKNNPKIKQIYIIETNNTRKQKHNLNLLHSNITPTKQMKQKLKHFKNNNKMNT